MPVADPHLTKEPTMETLRVMLSQEDAEALGVEREAEYREFKTGEWYVNNRGSTTKAGCKSAFRRLVVKKKMNYAEQLRESGWDPPVRGCILRVWGDGICYVRGYNPPNPARLLAGPPVLPSGLWEYYEVDIDNDGRIHNHHPE